VRPILLSPWCRQQTNSRKLLGGAVDGSTARKPQVARMKLRDGASNNAKGWILFWLLGYPIAVAAFIALFHLPPL
jgi:hypothetical protein